MSITTQRASGLESLNMLFMCRQTPVRSRRRREAHLSRTVHVRHGFNAPSTTSALTSSETARNRRDVDLHHLEHRLRRHGGYTVCQLFASRILVRSSADSGTTGCPSNTEFARIISSKPGFEKMNATPSGSFPVFFTLIVTFRGM